MASFFKIKQEDVVRAARTGNLEKLQKWAEQAEDLNKKVDGSNTLLHLASENKSTDCVHFLCSNPQVRRDIQNGKNQTPLHVAISRELCSVVNELTRESEPSAGVRASLRLQDSQERTAIHLAAENSTTIDIFELLLEKIQDYNIPGEVLMVVDRQQRSILHVLARHAKEGKMRDIVCEIEQALSSAEFSLLLSLRDKNGQLAFESPAVASGVADLLSHLYRYYSGNFSDAINFCNEVFKDDAATRSSFRQWLISHNKNNKEFAKYSQIREILISSDLIATPGLLQTMIDDDFSNDIRPQFGALLEQTKSISAGSKMKIKQMISLMDGDDKTDELEKQPTLLPRFADVYGQSFAVEMVQRTIFKPWIGYFAMKPRPDKIPASTRRLLLYGPPGTGKSMLCRALARELDVPYHEVHRSLMDKYYGGSTELIEGCLSEARRKASKSPKKCCVVCIDEIEEVAAPMPTDTDHALSFLRPIRGQLCRSLELPKETNLIICATTNYISGIDEAIRSRFPTKVFMTLPDDVARRQFMTEELDRQRVKFPEQKQTNINVAELTLKTEFMTFRDMAQAIENAQLQDALELTQAGILQQLSTKIPISKTQFKRYLREGALEDKVVQAMLLQFEIKEAGERKDRPQLSDLTAPPINERIRNGGGGGGGGGGGSGGGGNRSSDDEDASGAFMEKLISAIAGGSNLAALGTSEHFRKLQEATINLTNEQNQKQLVAGRALSEQKDEWLINVNVKDSSVNSFTIHQVIIHKSATVAQLIQKFFDEYPYQLDNFTGVPCLLDNSFAEQLPSLPLTECKMWHGVTVHLVNMQSLSTCGCTCGAVRRMLATAPNRTSNSPSTSSQSNLDSVPSFSNLPAKELPAPVPFDPNAISPLVAAQRRQQLPQQIPETSVPLSSSLSLPVAKSSSHSESSTAVPPTSLSPNFPSLNPSPTPSVVSNSSRRSSPTSSLLLPPASTTPQSQSPSQSQSQSQSSSQAPSASSSLSPSPRSSPIQTTRPPPPASSVTPISLLLPERPTKGNEDEEWTIHVLVKEDTEVRLPVEISSTSTVLQLIQKIFQDFPYVAETFLAETHVCVVDGANHVQPHSTTLLQSSIQRGATVRIVDIVH